MSKRGHYIRDGKRAFGTDTNPDQCCPYNNNRSPYPRACWMEGWYEAKAEHEEETERANIGYNWEDPDIDPTAAIRQLQDMFDEQLRNK